MVENQTFVLGPMPMALSQPMIGYPIPGILKQVQVDGPYNYPDKTSALKRGVKAIDPVKSYGEGDKMQQLLDLIRGKRRGLPSNESLAPGSNEKNFSNARPQMRSNYERLREDLSWRHSEGKQ